MLARKRSLVSCSADVLLRRGRARSRSTRGSTPPRACRPRSRAPCPCSTTAPSNVSYAVTLTRWNSSWRECGKCSQRWLVTATPARLSSALSSSATSVHARAAAGAGLGARLDGGDGGEALRGDGLADRALRDVVAGADMASAGSASGPKPARGLPRALRQDQLVGIAAAARLRSARSSEQLRVADGVADQDAAEQALLVGADDELLVDAAVRCRRADSVCAPGVQPKASPKLATSTPRA